MLCLSSFLAEEKCAFFCHYFTSKSLYLQAFLFINLQQLLKNFFRILRNYSISFNVMIQMIISLLLPIIKYVLLKS